MAADKYASLTSLKLDQPPSAYRIRYIDRKSDVTIIAPHGGYIEPGTSALAQAVAGKECNLFDFQGLLRKDAFQLHVTATNFRDPQLSSMLARSRAAVSFHTMGSAGKSTIWLGGLNKALKAKVQCTLEASGFDINPDSPKYKGISPHNVVNLAKEHGVQLELSYELIDELFKGRPFLQRPRSIKITARFVQLVTDVRTAISELK